MNSSSLDKKGSVVFLFINGPHHVYHLIMPALRFAETSSDFETKIISGNPRNTDIIIKSAKKYGISNFELIDIPLPFRYRINRYKDKLYPPVYTRIKKITTILSNASAIISTSHELPEYMKEHEIEGPLLLYLYHGTGTRAYGFESKLNMFDHIFVPGEYHLNRLRQELSLPEEKMILTGKPKLDWLRDKSYNSKGIFNNDNPIVYYNPHWDMRLSSYLIWRKFILDFFSKHNDYNLIFSPHPLVKHLSKKAGYDIENSEINSDNIKIDHDSQYCIDGTYNSIANVYVGDVSSMVTEWVMLRPRPCIFINAHQIDWMENDDYHFWRYGSVVNQFEKFPELISRSLEINDHKKIQLEMRDKFIHNSDQTSSDICAQSIKTILQGTSP